MRWGFCEDLNVGGLHRSADRSRFNVVWIRLSVENLLFSVARMRRGVVRSISTLRAQVSASFVFISALAEYISTLNKFISMMSNFISTLTGYVSALCGRISTSYGQLSTLRAFVSTSRGFLATLRGSGSADSGRSAALNVVLAADLRLSSTVQANRVTCLVRSGHLLGTVSVRWRGLPVHRGFQRARLVSGLPRPARRRP